MDIEECKNKIAASKTMIDDAYAAIAPDKLKVRRSELEIKQNDPALYSDPKAAQAVNSEAKYIDNTLGAFDKLFAKVNDLYAMAELLAAEADDELLSELFTETDALSAEAERRRSRHCSRASTTSPTRYSRCTQARAARKRRIGCPCCSACTECIAKNPAIRSRS